MKLDQINLFLSLLSGLRAPAAVLAPETRQTGASAESYPAREGAANKINSGVTLSTVGLAVSAVSKYQPPHAVMKDYESDSNGVLHDRCIASAIRAISGALDTEKLIGNSSADEGLPPESGSLINAMLSASITSKAEVQISNPTVKKGAVMELTRESVGGGFFRIKKVVIVHEAQHGTVRATIDLPPSDSKVALSVAVESTNGLQGIISSNISGLKRMIEKRGIGAHVFCR